MKKNDLILAGIILLAAVGIFLFYTGMIKEEGWVLVTADKKEYGRYSLEKEQDIDIDGTNVLRIKDGKAKMISANCPDKLCVHQKEISGAGESIVCLPNKVVVEITGKEAHSYDAVAG